MFSSLGDLNLSAIEADGSTATTINIATHGEALRLLSCRHIDFQNQDSSKSTNGNGTVFGWRRKIPVFEVASGRAVFMKTMELPQMPKNEILETLQYLERDSAPFQLSGAGLDAWTIRASENGQKTQMKVMMAAMGEKELLRRKERSKRAGLNLSSVTTAPAAIGALLRYSQKLKTDSPTLFVYLNETVTGICVFKDSVPIFTRELFFGTTATSTVSADQLERVAKEISKSLDYFARSSAINEIKGGYIIGKGATIENIETFLGKWTGVSLKVYDPLEDFLSRDSKIDINNGMRGPQMALAVGAALDRGKTINLLRKHRSPFLMKKPYIAVASIVLILFISMASLHKISADLDTQITTLGYEVRSLEKNQVTNETLLRKLSDITTHNRVMKLRTNAYPTFDKHKYDWLHIFRDIATIMPSNGKLTKWVIDLDEGKKSFSDDENVSLHGRIRGTSGKRLEGLSALLAKLEKSRHFEAVTLRRTEIISEQASPRDQMSFEIKAKLSKDVTHANPGLQ